MPLVLRLPRNKYGRDFAVGDIHGCYSLLERALQAVGFNPDIDRLFSVGDLIDRGPESKEAFEFLKQSWFYAVRGNHEDSILDWLGVRQNSPSEWVDEIPDRVRKVYRAQLLTLPYAIELATPRGPVGLVHADVPKHLSWDLFLQDIEDGDDHTQQHALWSRHRVESGYDGIIPGINLIYTGHTVVPNPLLMGNVLDIDTGGVYGHAAQSAEKGYLTLIQIDGNIPYLDDTFELNDTPFTGYRIIAP